jgi:hypothetical protein
VEPPTLSADEVRRLIEGASPAERVAFFLASAGYSVGRLRVADALDWLGDRRAPTVRDFAEAAAPGSAAEELRKEMVERGFVRVEGKESDEGA